MKTALPPVETVNAKEVASLLGTTAPQIHAAILNGTFPVGLAMTCEGGKDRTIIIRARLNAWLAAKDLKGSESQ